MTTAVQSAQSKRLAVVSPYGNLRGIYTFCDVHEGRPAFIRVMRAGMNPAATTCIFFSNIFGPGARWFFGKSVPDGMSMRSFSVSLEDSADVQFPEAARWPLEDIFEVRAATDEDDSNEYFFPTCTNGQRSDGFHPSGSNARASIDNNFKVLGLKICRFGDLPGLDVVRGAYRKQALRLHPDKGGDKEEFQVLQRAYEEVVEAIIRLGGTQSQVTSQTGPCWGHDQDPPCEPEVDRGRPGSEPMPPSDGASGSPELSEAERRVRRQLALEAALRRHGW